MNYYRVTTTFAANNPETHPAFRPVDKRTVHYLATHENMPTEEDGPGMTARYARITQSQWDQTAGPGFESDARDGIETRTALVRC